MRNERTTCGKSDGGTKYDPQVGAAAQANAALAEKTQAWTQDFYNQHIVPMLEASTKATEQNTDQQNQLFASNLSQMKLQDERYRTLGIPAEDSYYKMVKDYSAPEEQERQASAALGDQKVAAQSAAQQQLRSLAGLGVDPTSPAAVSAASDMAVQNAALEASAQTRARSAAKSLGMQLTGDAANFGRGGQSGVLSFGAAAGGNSSNAAQVAQGGVGANTAGAAPMLSAFGTAQRAYGSNLDAYTSMANSARQQQGQESAGMGQLLGLAANAAITHYSDRRLKKNVRKLATLSSGLPFYEFHYIWQDDSAPKTSGFMADEVVLKYPEAVSLDANGYQQVDYSKVPF